MNKNITEEELLLRKRARRRLVGAVVLTVVAVILLPLIFDEPRPDAETHEIDIHLFPKDEVSTQSPLILPPENSTSDQSESQSDLLSDFSNTSEPSSQFVDTEERMGDTREIHIPIPGIKPRLAVVQTDVDQPSDVLQEYVVQLGAFSDQLKAQQHLDILRSNGLNAYMETHTVNDNVVTRVRIGSFSDRNTAENELEKLRRLGLDGVVTPK